MFSVRLASFIQPVLSVHYSRLMLTLYFTLYFSALGLLNAQLSQRSAYSPLVFGYVEPKNWGNYQNILDFDGTRLTHVLYAFAYPAPTGNVTLHKDDDMGRENAAVSTPMENDAPEGQCPCSGTCLKGFFHQLIYLKRKYPHLRTILSIGGWTFSCHFSTIFSDAAKSALFIKSATHLMNKYGFDGIDIDWEFPGKAGEQGCSSSPADWGNLVRISADIKAYWAKNVPKGQEPILTVCLPATSLPEFQPTLDERVLKGLVPNVDYFLVMAYEYQWESKVTAYGAPLYYNGNDKSRSRLTVSYSIERFLNQLPPSKVVMGVPAYAMGLNLEPQADARRCLGAKLQKLPSGSPALPTMNYLELLSRIADKTFQNATVDRDAVATWTCNATAFYSFDTPNTAKAKMEYIALLNLAGAMIWDLSTDKPTNHSKSILGGLTHTYVPSGANRRKFICIPSSTFCNVNCGPNQNPFELLDASAEPFAYVYDTDPSAFASPTGADGVPNSAITNNSTFKQANSGTI